MWCKKVTPETLTAFYDGGLSFLQRWSLGFHCLWCWRCQSDLLSLASCDRKLQKLAPIPVEPRASLQSSLRFIGTAELFMVDRRILKAWLAGILLIVALLGLVVWRFFTPEVTWAEVERAMSEVKTAHWTRTLTATPRQKLASDTSVLDRLVRSTDPALQKSPEVFQANYACSTEEKRRFAIALTPLSSTSYLFAIGDQLDAQRNPSFLRALLLPPQAQPKASVQLWQGRRVIAFSLANDSLWTSDRVLVDPKTRRILLHERLRTVEEVQSKFARFHEACVVTEYDGPIAKEFRKNADTMITGHAYTATREERIQLREVVMRHLARIHETSLKILPDWGAPMWSDNANPQTGRRQRNDEPLIITIELRNQHRLKVEKLPDGSFKEVE